MTSRGRRRRTAGSRQEGRRGSHPRRPLDAIAPPKPHRLEYITPNRPTVPRLSSPSCPSRGATMPFLRQPPPSPPSSPPSASPSSTRSRSSAASSSPSPRAQNVLRKSPSYTPSLTSESSSTSSDSETLASPLARLSIRDRFHSPLAPPKAPKTHPGSTSPAAQPARTPEAVRIEDKTRARMLEGQHHHQQQRGDADVSASREGKRSHPAWTAPRCLIPSVPLPLGIGWWAREAW